MYTEIKQLNLPEGIRKSPVIFFEENDKKIFKGMFTKWIELCKESLEVGGTRIINFPESLSEAMFCLIMGFGRVTYGVKGAVSSFDAYDFSSEERVQIKAAASTGPSSFGPRSEYDSIYFVYLREMAESKKNKRNFSGKYEIYKLDTNIFPDLILNKRKNETFKDQQNLGKRPRLEIAKNIIDPLGLKPINTGNMADW